MKYQHLVGTGLNISNLTLGTMTLNSLSTEAEAIRLILEAHNQGIISFDMAESYERSEILIGKAIREMDRSSIILISKVFGCPSSKNVNNCGLSSKHIRHAIEKCLKQVGTDYIDIYFFHGMDPITPIEESLITIDNLIREGKICYYGLSNFTAWQTIEILWKCSELGLIKPAISQSIYNLLTRDIEKELLPCLERYDIGVFAYNVLAGGMLTGKYSYEIPKNSRFATNTHYRDRYWNNNNIDAVAKLSAIAQEYGMSLLDFTMGWTLSHKNICSCIVGCSSVEQLNQLVKCSSSENFPENASALCDEVWTHLSGERQFYGRYFQR